MQLSKQFYDVAVAVRYGVYKLCGMQAQNRSLISVSVLTSVILINVYYAFFDASNRFGFVFFFQ